MSENTCFYAKYDVFGQGLDTLLTSDCKRKLYIRIDQFTTNNPNLFKEGKYFVQVEQEGTYKVSIDGYLDFDCYDDVSVMLVNLDQNEILGSNIVRTENNFPLNFIGNLNTGDRLAVVIVRVCSCDEIKAKKMCTVKVNFNMNLCGGRIIEPQDS